jgi:RNA polymerase sigma-70 factor (ECF subfamily)
MERDLIRRCARGDEAAFRELVERLEKPLINFVTRYLGDRSAAEDVFQETFVRVLRNIADFEPQASLSTWVFTIARNLCLDRLKARRRHREVSIDAPQRSEGGKVIDFRDALRDRERGPAVDAEEAEMRERVKRALGTLGPAKREVLILRVFVGMPYEEVAKIVGAPVGTVKFRVHEAVRELAGTMRRGTEETEVG